jgi:hypothetical protein
MTTETTNGEARTKYPWEKWLKGSSPKKPTTIVFGKDVPLEKKPLVLVTQLHQWGLHYGLWVFTSVAHDKSKLLVYGVPIRKGKERPPSVFPSPKKGTHHASKNVMAKKKAAGKKASKSTKKSAKKGTKKAAAAA